MARKTKTLSLPEDLQGKKELCEASLVDFIEYVQPKRFLGDIHREICQWWNREDAKSHQLLLLPRDHMKSALLAFRIAHALTVDPTKRILLISSTSNLATKQLKFIKDILTCDRYRLLWPEMVNKDEMRREKWTEREISVDHPARKEWSIRDPSIFTAGLTTNVVGMHCDIAALDDVVVASNAYTEEGRSKVEEQYGYLSSIEAADAVEWVVGTRYHPNDLYGHQLSMEVEEHNENGTVISGRSLFEVFERQVESVGDGSGEYIWPRQQGPDGKWFGFNQQVLATKRSQYTNRLHFRAQYYNDPHDVDNAPIQRSQFQYYDRNYLAQKEGRWFFKGERINVFAAVDFAYSVGQKADYTAIVVVGCDKHGNHYVLDIDRFKTDGRVSEYFTHILKLYEKWNFRKIRAEVTAAQTSIVKTMKEDYIRPFGLSLIIEEFRPSRWQGSKEERILATLEPKYSNGQIWHYHGGNCNILEEELVLANPSHDDVKDALASAIDFAIPPQDLFRKKETSTNDIQYHSRWGGVA